MAKPTDGYAEAVRALRTVRLRGVVLRPPGFVGGVPVGAPVPMVTDLLADDVLCYVAALPTGGYVMGNGLLGGVATWPTKEEAVNDLTGAGFTVAGLERLL